MTTDWLSEGATDDDMRALGAQDAIAEEACDAAERRAGLTPLALVIALFGALAGHGSARAAVLMARAAARVRLAGGLKGAGGVGEGVTRHD